MNNGQIAYEAYCDAVGWKAWNGDNLPTWDMMCSDDKKSRLVKAWQLAGAAVIKAYSDQFDRPGGEE